VSRLKSILAVVAVAVSATPAWSQQLDTPYRFVDTNQQGGGYAGWVFTSTGRLDAGPKPAPVFGGRWGIRVSGPFSLGAEVGFMPTTRTVRDTVFVAQDSLFRAIGEANQTVVTAMGNIIFNVTGGRTWYDLAPFVVAGAGAAIGVGGRAPVEADLAPTERFDFGTSFAGQLGAGVDWFPSRRVSLRADFRNVLWKLGVPEDFLRTEAGRLLPRSEWEQNFVVSAGMSIHF
jgi:opacity protein-like surface antigen